MIVVSIPAYRGIRPFSAVVTNVIVVLHDNLAEFSRRPFLCRSFFWAPLQASSCVRQLLLSRFRPYITTCDLNHRLAIPEPSFGRFGAYKSCKSEVQVNAFSEL